MQDVDTIFLKFYVRSNFGTFHDGNEISDSIKYVGDIFILYAAISYMIILQFPRLSGDCSLRKM